MEEANGNLEKKKELSNQIELMLGFGELREKLNESAEGKFWKANGEDNRQEEVAITPPTIIEDGA